MTQVLEVPYTADLVPPLPVVPPYEVVEARPPSLPAFEVVSQPVIEAEIVPLPVLEWQPAKSRESTPGSRLFVGS